MDIDLCAAFDSNMFQAAKCEAIGDYAKAQKYYESAARCTRLTSSIQLCLESAERCRQLAKRVS